MKRWLGQSTTGTGAATLLATISSLAAGSLSLDHALPLLAAGIVGLIWPENCALQKATGNAAASIEDLLAVYRAGLNTDQATRSAAQTEAMPIKR
jgi:hypothetical protein